MLMTLGQTGDISISWNTHALITRLASQDIFNSHSVKPVLVTPVEELLHECRDDLLRLGQLFCRKLRDRLGLRPTVASHGKRLESVEDFFRLFIYNPGTGLGYVRVFDVNEMGPDVGHDQSRDGPPGHSYVPMELGSVSSAMDVFVTYSDEPDWGMDQDIFSVQDYELGSPPFGPLKGPSSQAPFHMDFPHESRLTYWIVPGLSMSLLSLRAESCLNLSKLAFEKEQDYWGWRFLAWGAHYLQDVTCPFHCCPFPPGKTRMLLKFFQNPNPGKFYNANRNLLRNRHSLFESAVSYLMNKHVKKKIPSPFLDALKKNPGGSTVELESLIREVSKLPNILAPKINDLMVDLYSTSRIDDPGYHVDDDADFVIALVIEEAIRNRSTTYDEFVFLVSECLSQAGRVTRFALKSRPR